ncbi:MAG TPA: adenylosuccinate synthase [Spirochaetia bacterium]|nr:adenylosuccinate synthase [Spirochaetia bacterium]
MNNAHLLKADICVGGQWGDEGKAKMIDFLSKNYNCIIRYQGGANAGHSVIHGREKYIFHLIPSGILYPDTICILGNGLVVDPEALLSEIDTLAERGIFTEGRLKISSRLHLVLPVHKELDISREAGQNKKIGTTGRGIGPAYIDKAARIGIRFCDLENAASLEEKLKENIREKESLLKNLYGSEKTIDVKALTDSLLCSYERLKKYVVDLPYFFYEMKKPSRILLEGAPGTGLDMDFGTYPFVTSSNPVAGGAVTGSSIPMRSVNDIIGIFKAYITRVGEGPLPTEVTGTEGERLREYGSEYGATTGRPRTCGWFDGVQGRYAVLVNGLNKIALTKLDILSNYQSIPFCTHYKINGKTTDIFPARSELLARAEPVYREFPGWNQPLTGIKSFRDLPDQAKRYIDFLSDYLSCPVSYISVGADREDTIEVN